MKQVLQHLRNGVLEVADLPTPKLSRGNVLIQTQASLISAGTERMLVEFGKANLLQKARSQPERVKQVLQKVQTDGLVPTMEAVLRKLDQPLPLGYSNAGLVLEVGAGVTDIQPGDRVASNGQHAELVSVPRNLCALIPEGVSYEEASFTTLGSIALQGIRLAEPTFGERFIVFGVGLLGLLTIQLLIANGCEVLAVDLNAQRLKLAADFGAETANISLGEDPVDHAMAWTRGQGVDGVLVTASAKTDEIMHQAAQACRKRGRIILVGVVGLQLQRSDFYEKELTFQVSCSYGPGRYDDAYEKQGQDYPFGHVRWTEQRNFEAVLQAMQKGRLDVTSLISHRYPIAQAQSAYGVIQDQSDALGVMLTYPEEAPQLVSEMVITPKAIPKPGKPRVGLVGIGNFAVGTLLPALSKLEVSLDALVDRKPFAVRQAAKKFKAYRALTNHKDLLLDESIDAVFLVTGHHLHADQVCEALDAGKHVFVEKPLAIDNDQLNQIIEKVKENPDKLVMTGFNRRFSPHIQHIKGYLRGRSAPLCMQMTVNAGVIPPDHWTQDPKRGGGRIIGEACHFIDLLAYLAESPVVSVSAMMIGQGAAVLEDKMSITFQMADGSIGTVHYFANGTKSFPKETLEVFSDQRVIRMENYRETKGFGFSNFQKLRTMTQDKGHRGELEAFVKAITQGGTSPISFADQVNITRASFAAMESAQEGKVIQINQLLEVDKLPQPETADLQAPEQTHVDDVAAPDQGQEAQEHTAQPS